MVMAYATIGRLGNETRPPQSLSVSVLWCADAGQEHAEGRAQAGAVVSVQVRMEGGMLMKLLLSGMAGFCVALVSVILPAFILASVMHSVWLNIELKFKRIDVCIKQNYSA